MSSPALTAPSPVLPATRSPRRRWLRKLGFAVSVFVIVSPAILVFLWMLSLALKNEIDNLAYPPVFIPSPPTFQTRMRNATATHRPVNRSGVA